MLSRITQRMALKRALARPSPCAKGRAPQTQRRSLTSAPRPGDGPLMERRADRELPDVQTSRFRWSRTFPIFFGIVAATSIAIFNYQKLSSPVVESTLYALRTNPRAREYLGDEIYFKAQIPWISGEMNQLHGRIDIKFNVKGTKRTGVMRFASFRPTPRGMFETTEWSLETEDGKVIDLLEEGDPFRAINGRGPEPELDLDDAEDAKVRGFRQMPK
ncbi:cytochrome oxidase assembly protein 1 [Neurospora sp. IMI 360204]|nr:cytochrome oxidase assembly protein 1 [Neurospora sp. IMI 360204]